VSGPEEAVRDWVGAVAGVGGDPVLSALVPLGGFSADARRLDVTCDGRFWSFVVKRPQPWSPEAVVLRLLRSVRIPAGRVPTLVGEGADDRGAWLVATFEPGVHPAGGPDVVFDTLARVHAHPYVPAALTAVSAIDVAWWAGLCDFVAKTVEGSVPEAEQGALLEAPRRWAVDPRIVEALAVLPVTLVHRDMHALNVVVDGDDATIIDWGEAKRGPAWVDLPNVTQRGTTAMAAYDAAWLDATGRERDTRLDDVGWAWAQAQVLVQYLPYAAEHVSIERARQMAADADTALGELGAALSRLG
jgi:hypothetical protein